MWQQQFTNKCRFCTFFMYTLLESYPPNWTCYGKMCIPCLVVSGNWALLALVRWNQQQKNKKLLHHKPPSDLVASQRCLQTVASLKMCNEGLWPYSPGPPCHHDLHIFHLRPPRLKVLSFCRYLLVLCLKTWLRDCHSWAPVTQWKLFAHFCQPYPPFIVV